MFFEDENYKFVYKGPNRSFAKGDDIDFCLETLEYKFPGDTFVVSADEQTITHYSNGIVFNILQRVKPE